MGLYEESLEGYAAPMGTGCDAIAEERWRQIFEEGWTHAHDDQHIPVELAAAGACYAAPIRAQEVALRALWPSTWDCSWWKPNAIPGDLSSRRRDLVKAGALIAAEIDRIDRFLDRNGNHPQPKGKHPFSTGSATKGNRP